MIRINNGQIRRIYQLFDAHGYPEEERTRQLHSRYGKTRVKDLDTTEAQEFITWLQHELKERTVKSRKTVIHYLCLLGYTTQDNKPDIDRINQFIVNIGSNNPKKKILNFLYPHELNKVVTQVKAMYQKEINRK